MRVAVELYLALASAFGELWVAVELCLARASAFGLLLSSARGAGQVRPRRVGGKLGGGAAGRCQTT